MRRVARYGDGFTGPPNRELYEAYRLELQTLGKDPSTARVKGILPGAIVVSEDPARTFDQLAPYTIYWANSYAKWLQGTAKASTRQLTTLTNCGRQDCSML